jgi:hypothetical protein
MTRHEDLSETTSPELAAATLAEHGMKVDPNDILDVAVRSKLDFRKRPFGQHYVRVVTKDGSKLFAPIGTVENPPQVPAAV